MAEQVAVDSAGQAEVRQHDVRGKVLGHLQAALAVEGDLDALRP
jgi:hypothetical protein